MSKLKPNPQANDVTRMIQELGDQRVGEFLGVTREQAGKWRRAGKMPESRRLNLLELYQGDGKVVPIRAPNTPMPADVPVPATVPDPVEKSELRRIVEEIARLEKLARAMPNEKPIRHPFLQIGGLALIEAAFGGFGFVLAYQQSAAAGFIYGSLSAACLAFVTAALGRWIWRRRHDQVNCSTAYGAVLWGLFAALMGSIVYTQLGGALPDSVAYAGLAVDSATNASGNPYLVPYLAVLGAICVGSMSVSFKTMQPATRLVEAEAKLRASK